MSWRHQTSYVIIGPSLLFALGLLYAAWLPWSLRLAFPPYRIAMGVVGLGLCYFVLTQILNVTRLLVRDGAVYVRSGPLPWTSGARVKVARIVAISYETLWGVCAEFGDGESEQLVHYEYCDAAEVAPLVADILGVPVEAKTWRTNLEVD